MRLMDLRVYPRVYLRCNIGCTPGVPHRVYTTGCIPQGVYIGCIPQGVYIGCIP